MIMMHYRDENEAETQAATPTEVPARLANLAAPAAAPPPDPLASHGPIWTFLLDYKNVIVDPTAEIQWGPAPRINWGNTHAETVPCRPLNCFLALFPMGFLREVLLPATNANLQEMNAAVTTSGELL